MLDGIYAYAGRIVYVIDGERFEGPDVETFVINRFGFARIASLPTIFLN